ncbi:MAG: phosphatidate cytidylyltransferase [Planctomycetales bacterium]
MLSWRLFLGTIFVGLLAFVFWIDINSPAIQGVALFSLALLLTPLAAAEMIRLTTIDGQRPLAWTVYSGSLLVVLATGLPHLPGYPADCPIGSLGWPLLALVVAVLMATVGEIMRFDKPQGVSINLSLAVMAIVYVGLLLSFLVQLRFIGGAAWNGLPLISMLVVVKLCDIGAYTVGRLFGKHKLAPKLSPGKTIEGVVGGLLFAVGGSWLVMEAATNWFETPGLSVPVVVGYGILIGVAGILGDLTESMFKRASGHKDSSSWMPGFGGVLDLLDSPLMAAPVAYFFWMAILS